MNKQITINRQTIPYTLRQSTRARRLRLAVYPDGSVVVTTPYQWHETRAEKFLYAKAHWLVAKRAFFKEQSKRPVVRYSRADYLRHKADARRLVEKKIAFFNQRIQGRYKNISIKNQKTRWGSCSKHGNLNFNFKLLFLPEHLQDYIIVHELCHLKELNHSHKFWSIVRELLPDYKELRKQLRLSQIELR